MRFFPITLLFFFFLAGFPLKSFSAELVLQFGFVKIMRGMEVLFHSTSGTSVPLEINDRIQTGSATKAEIFLRGREESIKLGSRSFFGYDNLSEEQTQVSLLTGKGQFNVSRTSTKTASLKKKSRRKSFKVRTVTAVIGVIGTEFVLGTSGTQTNLLTLSGSVGLAPLEAPEIEVEVPENQASQVQKGMAPTKPVNVPPELQKQIVSQDSPKVFNVVQFPPAMSIDQAKQEKKEKEEEQKEEEQKEEEQKEEEQEEGEKEQEQQAPADEQPSQNEPPPPPESLEMIELPVDLTPLENLQKQLDKTKQDIIQKESHKTLEIKIQRE